mmetsp:Transcript_60643/g.179830  ORF Transcript_60643/g.179830 Transcript_60643/m.179830 type:complete len:136 (-) Transcript_60643:3424-3831(-)
MGCGGLKRWPGRLFQLGGARIAQFRCHLTSVAVSSPISPPARGSGVTKGSEGRGRDASPIVRQWAAISAFPSTSAPPLFAAGGGADAADVTGSAAITSAALRVDSSAAFAAVVVPAFLLRTLADPNSEFAFAAAS